MLVACYVGFAHEVQALNDGSIMWLHAHRSDVELLPGAISLQVNGLPPVRTGKKIHA